MAQIEQPGPSESQVKGTTDRKYQISLAITNCINSFQGLESESYGGLGGRSYSHVSYDRFIRSVQVLEAMILEREKDELYRKHRVNCTTWTEVFHAVQELLDRIGFWQPQVSLLE